MNSTNDPIRELPAEHAVVREKAFSGMLMRMASAFINIPLEKVSGDIQTA